MDIVILGGGIVGLTMANLLARDPDLKIALLEPHTPQLVWDPSIYDVRCSAINIAVQNIFSHLGIWKNIIAERVGIYDRMLVWDQELHNKLDFNADAMNVYNLGYIVENRVMVKALYQRLLTMANVEIISAKADKFIAGAEYNTIAIGARNIACKLVIGADGANSWLRTQAQLTTVGWDCKQIALVATIRTEIPHANIAQQRFMPDGPLAFLPLAESNLCSIVWSSSPENIQVLTELAPQEFCVRLAKEFAFKYGALSLQSPRVSFPLRMQHATEYIAPRVALIGDAAHVIHPMAGLGLNLGILDAAILDEVLQQVLQGSEDVGDLKFLRQYQRRRKGHNLSVLALLESLQRIFAEKRPAFSVIRANGLQILNQSAFIKKTMMRFATGLDGDLPQTARYS